MEPPKPSPILSLKKPWIGNQNDIWLASKVELQRNIEKFKFPGKLDLDRKRQIVSLTSQELLALEPLKQAELLKVEDLSAFEKEYLTEHFINATGFDQEAIGEALLFDRNGDLLVLFNMKDHIRLLCIDTSKDIEHSWNKLVKIETSLGRNVSYSYSQKFGFLTADPAKCGIALTVTLYLQLSGLIHAEKIDAVLEASADDSIMVTGIQGNPTEIVGDVLVLQNNYSLGVTEENILSSMRLLASKLTTEEKNCRNEITTTKNTAIMDKVSRAFAVLLFSYKIEEVEALNALSLLKLGSALGWIGGVTADEVNQLFFNCRRGHLLAQYNEKINQPELAHKRAEYIHMVLKEAKLLI